ncbi:MAG: GNAT family N-acetyltransferase [Acidobacteria bacterium]|nr:GNAT family N-acetyltransferase [Acidobacteriota bacterium]
MTQEINITRGFSEELRSEAASLFDAAFGPKLCRNPQSRTSLAVLQDALDPSHAFVATSGGRIIGIAGFKTPDGALTSGIGPRLLRARLVVWRSLRAVTVLALFQRDLPNQLLMDGISVSPEARGCGIGTKLLDRIKHFAAEEGYRTVRLDVIDTNHAARRLYERQGFVATATSRFGYLRWLLGFSAATTLEYRVNATEA